MSLHKFLNDFEIFRDDHEETEWTRPGRPRTVRTAKTIENMDRKIATRVR